MVNNNFYEQVYAVVRLIPRGKVTSYGRIARMLGRNRAARAVGYALNGLKGKQNDPAYADVPWHRVVNHVGKISTAGREASANHQVVRLQAEGVLISDETQVEPLEQFLWQGLSLFDLDEILKL